MQAMHLLSPAAAIWLLTSVLGVLAAHAATNLELQLEAAIYEEETVGDVQAALEIYQAILAEGEGQRPILARAHERMAGCYLRLGREEEARRELRKVIDAYPEETAIVDRARQFLSRQPPLEPTPWLDGEVLTYVIRLPTGVPFGIYAFAVESRREDGVDAWQIRVRRYHDSGLNDQGRSLAIVEQESMRPLRSEFVHRLYGSAQTSYGEGSYRLETHGASGPAEVQSVEHEGTVFDNEEWIYLTRRLPLALGYKTSLPLNTYAHPQPLDVSFEVTAQTQVEVPAGSFEAYKAETSIGQTFFYSTGRERYLVKMKLPGADAELVAVSQRREAESKLFHDEALGFALTAPPGWLFHPNEALTSAKKTLVHLLDPLAEQRSFFMAEKRSTKKGGSLEEQAREAIASDSAVLAEHTIREDSWRRDTIAERPALYVITDFQDGDRQWSRYLVWVSGEGLLGRFIFNVPPEKLEVLRTSLDEVVAGLHLD